MHLPRSKTTLALFCKVVDNFGDIGICWRLARQLEEEHHIAVTLWVDDLVSFKRICPELNLDCKQQQLNTICVRHWSSQDEQFQINEIADIVIEFFGCDIPPDYIATMAKYEQPPVWINLEGLSAEEWVEGCHTLPSSHPQYPLTKYFFFPGFTPKTGGLLREKPISQQQQDFLESQQTRTNFLQTLGVPPTESGNFTVSMFCYPHAPVQELFNIWEHGHEPITCLVPVGVANSTVERFLAQEAKPGASRQRGNLVVRLIPFVPQQDYDKLLWSCDLNFVRGEDSFVRAQWALQPFIWHIYPQDENLHHKKLRAFLQKHEASTESSKAMSLRWNAAIENENWSELWSAFRQELPEIRNRSAAWQRQMQENGDMTANLMNFVNSKR